MRTDDSIALDPPPTVDARLFHDAARRYGHRWAFDIIEELRHQPMRFTDLMRAITPTPHPKSLRDSLRRLQDQGLIAHPEVGDGARYEITAAGVDLASVVTEFATNLQHWSATHQASNGTDIP
jgi:DNA-binding HxlR family transcriptional regulator